MPSVSVAKSSYCCWSTVISRVLYKSLKRFGMRIQETPIRTAHGQSFSFTVSIGCTVYNGHPDYQRFLDTADSALYAAKNKGRNCIHVTEKVLSV